MTPNRTQSTLIKWILFAKGITIALVVLFHYGPSFWWPHWFGAMAGVVYKFHMPAFMFLSGYLFTYDLRKSHRFFHDYRELVRKKFVRLVIPYLSVSAVFALLKIVGQSFFSHNPVSWSVLANVFIDPTNGPASVLWFLYCVIVFEFVFPVLDRMIPSDYWCLLTPLLIAVPRDTTLLCLDNLTAFFPFFALGVFARRRAILKESHAAYGLPISILAFVAICAVDPKGYLAVPPIPAFTGAIFGTLAVIYLSMLAADLRHASAINTLGKKSVAIYLFHQPIAWFLPIILAKYFQLSPNALMLGLPLASLAGLIVPCWLERFLMARPLLSVLFLGARTRIAVPG